MLGQHREAAIVLRPRHGDQTIDDLLLEHQHHIGDVVGGMKPPHQQGRRHIVGQIGHDPARARPEVPRCNSKGIGFDQFEPPSGGRLQLAEGAESPGIHLDGNDTGRPFEQQGAREPARTRTDLDHRPFAQGRRGACYATRKVEVEQEVLAEALLRVEAMRRDGLAQGRQGLDAVHAQGRRRRAMSSAMSMAASRLDGSARPVPAISSAVP